MAGTLYPQHSEGDTVVRWTKARMSALAWHTAVCPALLSMLGQLNFKNHMPIYMAIIYNIRGQLYYN